MLGVRTWCAGTFGDSSLSSWTATEYWRAFDVESMSVSRSRTVDAVVLELRELDKKL